MNLACNDFCRDCMPFPAQLTITANHDFKDNDTKDKADCFCNQNNTCAGMICASQATVPASSRGAGARRCSWQAIMVSATNGVILGT
eukprot:6346985-Amphidinium_carterae.1